MKKVTQRVVALNNVSSGTSVVIPLKNVESIGMMVEWGSGVTAGQVTFETADASDYADLWNPSIVLDKPTTVPSQTGLSVDMVGNYGRVRITTPIGNGNVKVFLYLRVNA